MAIFSSNHPLYLYMPNSLGPCDFLPFFLINVFQKKSLLPREGSRKILYTNNTQPSHTCVMKEYIPWVLSIPWVHIHTITPCVYHESLVIPWVRVNTMSPCLYHESLSIPRVLVYTMSPCQFHASISIPWVPANNMSQCL